METQMKRTILAALLVVASGCATLTEDAMTPVALSFSSGQNGHCDLSNKRGTWATPVPVTISVRKSDDALRYDCKTDDGRTVVGSIPSEMGAKIVASAVFIDLGITDAITDKHRRYASSYVIPIEAQVRDELDSGSTDESAEHEVSEHDDDIGGDAAL